MAERRLVYLAEPIGGHATTATIVALNRSLARAGLAGIEHRTVAPVRKLGRWVGRLRLQRNLVRRSGRTYIVALMWPNDGRFFPFGYFGDIVPYIFDCWPYDWGKWASIFRRNRIRMAFFSARRSAEHFRERLPGFASHWLPEACDPGDYEPGPPLAERSIDLLELGRKLLAFHDRVGPSLAEDGRRHVYSRDGTRTLVFPDQDALRAGLADTRIYVCFPKSVTHPGADHTGRERSAGLETATLRYFEGIASGCLLYGHCPAELEALFGYDPVIPYDPQDPIGQVRSILGSLDEHQAMVERNRRRLAEVGTWDHRVASMLAVLQGEDRCRLGRWRAQGSR